MSKQRKPPRSSAAARDPASDLRGLRCAVGIQSAKGWKLPPCPKIGRTMSPALLRYCDAHSVSLDWLLYGDLKGLQRMVRNRNGKPSMPTAKDRMLSIYRALTPEQQRIVDELTVKMLAERGRRRRLRKRNRQRLATHARRLRR